MATKNSTGKSASAKTVTALKHDEATRKNIPTAEYQSVMQKNEQAPVRVAYPRGVAGLEEERQQRNRDLDPQLVWRGKDEQDWSDLVVHAPPRSGEIVFASSCYALYFAGSNSGIR